MNTLTPRELEVYEKLLECKSAKAIAQELDCSHRTIEIHRVRIFEKMQVCTLLELIRKNHATAERESISRCRALIAETNQLITDIRGTMLFNQAF